MCVLLLRNTAQWRTDVENGPVDTVEEGEGRTN